MLKALRLIFAGAVATTAMTAFMMNARKIGLKKINIPGVLSQAANEGEDTQPGTKPWTYGLLAHYLLGTVVFPFTYDLVGRHVMPGRTPVQKASAWGAGLWAFSETVVMPLFNRGKEFRRPRVANTYGLAHMIYGWTFGMIARR